MIPIKNILDKLPAILRQRVEHYWQEFTQAVEGQTQPFTHPDLLNVVYRVWAYSDFAAACCIRYPDTFADLLRGGDLRIDYSRDTYKRKLQGALARVETEQALLKALRELRQREMLRIAWRELAGWAGLSETLGDLSAFAEASIDAALSKLHGWQCKELGVPTDATGAAQCLVVLGMGKLGGRELNFSSDIDLIFAYPEQGETRGRRHRISNEEYFTRLSQRLIHALAAVTAQGFVFRVDMRLRPFGDSGPLSMSFDAMEDYYQTHGREWERYAFIKARVVAGDQAQGQRLMDDLRPFVYRRYLDFGAFSALRNMKQLIIQEMTSKSLADNIKLGFGGIREIEFVAQAFQLIRGGRDKKLQERSVLRILEYLNVAHYLPAYVTQQLSTAYIFLRRLENRLQEMADQQTHTLPSDALQRTRLALSMSHETWEALEQSLDKHRKRVHNHFEQVFEAPQLGSQAQGTESTTPAGLEGLWQGVLDDAAACELLAELGYGDPPEALRWLTQLREAHAYEALAERGRECMDRLMPLLAAAAGQTDNSNIALTRLIRLIEAIARRTSYLALLVENPMALSQLVKLCAASPWIAGTLTRYPLLLDELLDPRSLYAPLNRDELESELNQTLSPIPPQDLEQQMEGLRHFKQVNTLRVAAADKAGLLTLMSVSDHLTLIAELILSQVLNLTWNYLVDRHGWPCCRVKGEVVALGFAIVAYGKLGGIELGYGSDLDLVFLYGGNEEGGSTTEGPKSIDNALFFARLGQRIIHMLSAHTPAGVLYEVDMRLRPSGAPGLLVSSLGSFADYQHNHAWTWEHQALVRARVVAEVIENDLAPRFAKLRRAVLGRARDRGDLRTEVRVMRERMRETLSRSKPGLFDLKQDKGGIADIEFMVQYAVLSWAHDHPELLDFPDNIRLLEGLAKAGLMAARDVQLLSDAYRAYRAAVHRLSLQEAPAQVDEMEFDGPRSEVKRIWQKLFETSHE